MTRFFHYGERINLAHRQHSLAMKALKKGDYRTAYAYGILAYKNLDRARIG